jgi:hypothetical protein
LNLVRRTWIYFVILNHMEPFSFEWASCPILKFTVQANPVRLNSCYRIGVTMPDFQIHLVDKPISSEFLFSNRCHYAKFSKITFSTSPFVRNSCYQIGVTMLDFQIHLFDKPICLEVLLSYRRHYARFSKSPFRQIHLLGNPIII